MTNKKKTTTYAAHGLLYPNRSDNPRAPDVAGAVVVPLDDLRELCAQVHAGQQPTLKVAMWLNEKPTGRFYKAKVSAAANSSSARKDGLLTKLNTPADDLSDLEHFLEDPE
jgi:hypothetical protein